MPYTSPRVCVFCNFVKPFLANSTLPSQIWRQSRSMAMLRKRRTPKRMSLSPNVSQPAAVTRPKEQARARRIDGPFGATNRRSANVREAPNVRSSAELKRSTRGRHLPQKERETFHALKMQKALSEVSYGRRSAIKAKIQSQDDFNNFGLMGTVEEAIAKDVLAGLTDIAPTPIQRLAIPTLLEKRQRTRSKLSTDPHQGSMDQFLLAAETGSGKTLAYLLPILHAIKRAEALEMKREAEEKIREEAEEVNRSFHSIKPPPLTTAPHLTTARPKAIILLPTSELVTQVGQVAKKLSHTVKFRTALISSAYSSKVIHNRLFAPTGIDVLISTPHLLASISKSDPNVLSRVTHLVVDEADSLLDRSFSPSTTTIIDKSTSSLKQLILCSATIPRSLDSFLRQRFPDMRRLVTPNLHAIPRRVQLGVIDIDKQPYQGNRMLACGDTIWSIGKATAQDQLEEEDTPDMKRMLVFVNEREKSQEVAEYLVSKGIDAVALNRDTPEQRQAEILSIFTSREYIPKTVGESTSKSDPGVQTYTPSSQRSAPLPTPGSSRKKLPNTKVLVTTDLGSRGIDTLAVKHVILYDVPHTTIDFIHRLGRTGRMGRRGRGIVLVGKHDRKDVVREVREGMFKGQALI